MHTLKGHRQLELCTEPPPLVAAWLCCLVARLCPTFCDPVDCRVAVLQDYRLPGPPLSPRVCSHSCPLSQGCRPTIPSSAALFSFCPSSFLASGSLLMSRLFTSGGQSIGASISASVLPVNIQVRFPLGWTGLISLLSKGLSESSPAPQFENINSPVLSLLYGLTLTSYMTTRKTIALTTVVMSLTSLSLGSPCPCEVGICVLFSGWLQELKEMITSIKQSPGPGP